MQECATLNKMYAARVKVFRRILEYKRACHLNKPRFSSYLGLLLVFPRIVGFFFATKISCMGWLVLWILDSKINAPGTGKQAQNCSFYLVQYFRCKRIFHRFRMVNFRNEIRK